MPNLLLSIRQINEKWLLNISRTDIGLTKTYLTDSSVQIRIFFLTRKAWG